MKVSIITATHNRQAYISDCIKSVNNQTYNKIEHIIVDGASKDKTLEIINSLPNRITKVISEPDKGIYDLRKKSLIELKSAGKSTYYLPAYFLLSTMVDKEPTMVDKKLISEIGKNIPNSIKELIVKLGKRSRNQGLMEKVILELCEWRELSISELANYIQPLIVKKKTAYVN